MICGFKQKFPWGEPTYFREKILANKNDGRRYYRIDKIHEVIQKNWTHKEGDVIDGMYSPDTKVLTDWNGHFWPFCTADVTELKPKLHTIREGNRWKAGDRIHMAYGVRTKNYQCFNEGIPELEFVKSVQSIEITHYTIHMKPLEIMGIKGGSSTYIAMWIDGEYYGGYRQVAINDGFEDVDQFYKWFKKDFSGQILHFSDLRY
jgi:hypothetical protein